MISFAASFNEISSLDDIYDSLQQVFRTEIKPFKTKKWLKYIFDDIGDDMLNIFYQKRKTGENDDFICKLIREDSVEEFIAYVNRSNFHLI
mgnify:CR=1 FL=1